MLRGDAVGCITHKEADSLMGQMSGYVIGDFDGSILLHSDDTITEQSIVDVYNAGVAGELYSERLGAQTRYRLGTYWTRNLPPEYEYEEEEAEEQINIY